MAAAGSRRWLCWFVLGRSHLKALRLSQAAAVDNKSSCMCLWWPGWKYLYITDLEYHSFFPFFCYLNSLANGNFPGRTASEAIVVVTKRNGENPSVRMSAFCLYFSYFFFPFFYCLLPSRFSQQEEKRGVGWGGESVSPASLFPSARRDLSGALLCEVWRVSNLAGGQWQKQTHVVNWWYVTTVLLCFGNSLEDF